MHQTVIETERLILRKWRKEDLPLFAKLNRDKSVMEFFPSTLTTEESNAFANKIIELIETIGWGLWAVEVKEIAPFIGFIGFHKVSFQAHFTPAIEIGYRLDKDYWGKGYAFEGASSVLKYGFETLKFKEIVAFTAKLNHRSIRLMERLKMTHKDDDDFLNPRLPKGHLLAPHVLYRKTPGN